jgi:lipopolysaccharide biosynthesis glycosyltransferase
MKVNSKYSSVRDTSRESVIKITDHNNDDSESTRESITYLKNRVKMLESKVQSLEMTVERLNCEKSTTNINSNIYGKVYLNQYIKEYNRVSEKGSDFGNKLSELKKRTKNILDVYSRIKNVN